MNKLIIASAISILSATAYATGKASGDPSGLEGSSVRGNGAQETASQIQPGGHDHGDNSFKNFTDHDHERMMAEDPVGHAAAMAEMQHDHGDNASKNFTDHDHERMMAEDPVGHTAAMAEIQHDHGDNTTKNFVEHEHK